MRHRPGERGFSLAETLVALCLIAVASAAMLPAVAAAGHLQRESRQVTDAVRIASARIESLHAGAIGAGGSLDTAIEGWSAQLDRGGADVAGAAAVYDCRWRVVAGDVTIVAVRVIARAGRADVTLSTAVVRD